MDGGYLKYIDEYTFEGCYPSHPHSTAHAGATPLTRYMTIADALSRLPDTHGSKEEATDDQRGEKTPHGLHLKGGGLLTTVGQCVPTVSGRLLILCLL